MCKPVVDRPLSLTNVLPDEYVDKKVDDVDVFGPSVFG